MDGTNKPNQFSIDKTKNKTTNQDTLHRRDNKTTKQKAGYWSKKLRAFQLVGVRKKKKLQCMVDPSNPPKQCGTKQEEK